MDPIDDFIAGGRHINRSWLPTTLLEKGEVVIENNEKFSAAK